MGTAIGLLIAGGLVMAITIKLFIFTGLQMFALHLDVTMDDKLEEYSFNITAPLMLALCLGFPISIILFILGVYHL